MLSVLVLCEQEGLFYTFFFAFGVLPIRNLQNRLYTYFINGFSWLDFNNISFFFFFFVDSIIRCFYKGFNVQLCESALLLSYVYLALPNLSFKEKLLQFLLR